MLVPLKVLFDTMDNFEVLIRAELINWQKQMQKSPNILDRLSKRMQNKVNSWLPEKVHNAITAVIKQMVKITLFGATYTTGKQLEYKNRNLEVIEAAIHERIKNYRNTAAIEGGITGAGGILTGLADFPLLVGIKLKLLFDIAAMYGYDVKDYKERLYILYIFELAFSSQLHRTQVYSKIVDWDERSKDLPDDINDFDWRSFQQEYRDYIDIAKMAQLIPIIGAPIGAFVNFRLIKKLGTTAMNAYRMRFLHFDKNSIDK